MDDYASTDSTRQMDFATILGVFAAFGLVFYAISLGGGVESFLDLKSFLIVVGGTLGAALVNFSLADFARTSSLLITAFFPDKRHIPLRIAKLLHYARRFRSENPQAVQQESNEEADRFLRSGLELLVEGHGDQEIRKVMGLDQAFLEDRSRRGAELFQTMGTIAPAMGLVGTLIGLTQMLQKLDNPENIGPAMAVALLTTFYGAILANLVFFPIAGKLRTRSEEEFLIRELTIEGVAGVAEGLNPRLIERRLLSFLPPRERISEYE